MRRLTGARRAGGRAGDAGAAGPGSGDRALLVPLALQNFLMTYNATAMNVALSAVVRDLHTSLTGVQSAISLYGLVVAAFLITGSKLGARHGYRRTFVLGAEIFVLGTLVTAVAPSLVFLLVGWSLLQGVGVALMIPAVLSLLTHASSGASRTKAFSAVGTAGGMGAAAGPILSGVITSYASWRVSFILGAVITGTVVLLLRRARAPEPPPVCDRRFDVPGAVLSAVGCGLLVIATLLAGRYGLFEARQDFEVLGRTLLPRGGLSPVVVLAGLGLLVLVAFAGWELRVVRRGKDPVVRVSVLRDRTIRTGSAAQAMQFLVPVGALFLVPVFLQTTLGLDALWSGLVLLPTAGGLLVAASLAAKAIAGGRMRHRTAQMWSFLCMLAGCLVIGALFVPREQNALVIGLAFAPGLFLIGLGQGLATTTADLIQSVPPEREVSDVTGLSRSGSYLGSSLGVALAGAFLTTALVHSFEAETEKSSVLTARQKQLVVKTLEEQVHVTAASDSKVRAKLRSQGVTGDAADEIVRINVRAREQALTFAVAGMAVLAVGGHLVTRRLPRVRARGGRPE
ncbi:MFS transporter [Streptomyces sp. F63]|uniref:MFS transporter n=1 Tax=Streptomyces sp. F63 TaxID=2824887 RepID=UPI001B38C82A|nr:MFS transporter [Streptomyces sp. F63]MBQ0987311.1 MFS transporter [Streptomyces sp. F63]